MRCCENPSGWANIQWRRRGRRKNPTLYQTLLDLFSRVNLASFSFRWLDSQSQENSISPPRRAWCFLPLMRISIFYHLCCSFYSTLYLTPHLILHSASPASSCSSSFLKKRHGCGFWYRRRNETKVNVGNGVGKFLPSSILRISGGVKSHVLPHVFRLMLQTSRPLPCHN